MKAIDFLNATDDPSEEALDFFKSKGWNNVHSAAIVGNLAHESAGLQPDIVEKGGSGYGLAQWTSPDRKRGLFEYAKTKGEKKPSFKTQLEYVQRELEGPYSNAASELLKTETLEDATRAFSSKYEVPGIPRMGSRFDKASVLLKDDGQNIKPKRKAIDFLNEEEPSMFSVSEAHAAEIPKERRAKMKAIDFLMSDDEKVGTSGVATGESMAVTKQPKAGQVPPVESDNSKTKQSAIDFLNGPDEPGMLSRAASATGDALSRSVGVVAGTANALSGFPFAMGGFKAANENPEEWAKLPFWEKALVAVGSGMESTWDSIAKEGSFGADVSDFNKFTFGKTTEEALPDNLKWAAPTLDLIQSVVMDPTVSFGTASKVLREMGARKTFGEGAKELFSELKRTGQVPVMATGELPPGILDDIKKLDALDQADKDAIRQDLLGLLNKRGEHQSWREDILANPPIKRGSSDFPRVSGTKGELAKPTISPEPGGRIVLTPSEILDLNVSDQAKLEYLQKIKEQPEGFPMTSGDPGELTKLTATPPPRAANIPPTPQERAAPDLSQADREAAQIKTWQPEERPLAGLEAGREEPDQVVRLRKLIEERRLAKLQEKDPDQIISALSPEGKVGRRVQRYEEPGKTRASMRPQGIYTTPSEFDSPHADLGGEQFFWSINPEAKVLDVTDMQGLDIAMRKGAIDASAGVAAVKKLFGAEEFDRLRNLSKLELVEEAKKLSPNTDYSGYYDRQDIMEVIGAEVARKNGYDAIESIDKQSPEFSEFVSLTENAMKPEDKQAPETIQRATGEYVKQKDVDQSLVDQLKADLEARKAGNQATSPQTDQLTNPLRSEVGGIRLPGMKRDKMWSDLMKQNPNWKRINDQITEPERRSGRLPSLTQLNVGMLDRFAPIKKVSPETYEDARKHSSFKDVAAMEFSELQDALKEVRNDEKLFRDYITAKRMETRANMLKVSDKKPQGVSGADSAKFDVTGHPQLGKTTKERIPGVGTVEFDKPTKQKLWFWQIKNPGDVKLDEARSAVKEIEDAYRLAGEDPVKLQRASDAWNEWTHKAILEPMKDSGIISNDAYNAILRDNDFYAAFEVIDKLPDDLSKLPGNLPSSEFFSAANQKIIKGLKGTEKKIADPVQSTIKKFLDAKALIARNKVASTLIDDIQTNPNSALQGVARPIAENAKDFAKLKKAGLNPIREGAWAKKDFDTIARFKDGKVEKYIVPKDLADSMKQLTPFQAPRWVHAINNVFRSSATSLYLPFTISNAMRDGFMAYATAPVYKAGDIAGKFQKDWSKGLVEGFKHEFGSKSDLVKEYLEHGGGFGWVGEIRTSMTAKSQLFAKTGLQKTATVIASPFKLIEKISSAVELAPRVGVYQRAKMVGKNADQAAMMARESTIDFSKGGTWTKVANQFIPFLNARVQGRAQVIKAFQEDRNNFLAKTLTGAVIPGMAAYAWNRMNYSDLYDDIPEHIKQNYFTIITGTDKDKHGKVVPKYLVIAKGDLGQMAVNPLEYGIDKLWDKDREGAKKFLVNYLAQLSPVDFVREGEVSGSRIAGSLLPPVVKGAAEDIANLNTFTGREVVPKYMEKTTPPEMQYKELTPETYKWLAGKLQSAGAGNLPGGGMLISPLRLQNFAQSVLAGYGREGLDPSAMMRGLSGRFVKTTGGAKEEKVWDLIEDMDKGYNYTRAYAKEMVKAGNRNEAMALVNAWNSGLEKRLKGIEQYDFKDKGGLRRDFMFSPKKIKNLMTTKKDDNRSPLDKRLDVK